jgi:hypothetical protein
MKPLTLLTLTAALAVTGTAWAGGGAHAALKGWRKKLAHADCNDSNNFCKVSHVKRFRGVYSGSDELLRLRCTNGGKRVRAYWGG